MVTSLIVWETRAGILKKKGRHGGLPLRKMLIAAVEGQPPVVALWLEQLQPPVAETASIVK